MPALRDGFGKITSFFCRQDKSGISGVTRTRAAMRRTGITICGGIPPDQIKIKKIAIDGKETGIDRLDWILRDVAGLKLTSDEAITDELEKRVRQFNYIPTKKRAEYRVALLKEFRMFERGMKPEG
jgi:hypothetical protein